jgi:hypothetical protein
MRDVTVDIAASPWEAGALQAWLVLFYFGETMSEHVSFYLHPSCLFQGPKPLQPASMLWGEDQNEDSADHGGLCPPVP